jgi:hypothetical protein
MPHTLQNPVAAARARSPKAGVSVIISVADLPQNAGALLASARALV